MGFKILFSATNQRVFREFHLENLVRTLHKHFCNEFQQIQCFFFRIFSNMLVVQDLVLVNFGFVSPFHNVFVRHFLKGSIEFLTASTLMRFSKAPFSKKLHFRGGIVYITKADY